MGVIRLNNIKVYAFHGCMDEEAKIGSDYRVDLQARGVFRNAATSDELVDAIDYVQLNAIVKQEMAIRSKLLEHVCQRIVSRILMEIRLVDEVTVAVSKINPPIGGDVESVTVELHEVR